MEIPRMRGFYDHAESTDSLLNADGSVAFRSTNNVGTPD